MRKEDEKMMENEERQMKKERWRKDER